MTSTIYYHGLRITYHDLKDLLYHHRGNILIAHQLIERRYVGLHDLRQLSELYLLQGLK